MQRPEPIVVAVAGILREGEPTCFAFEGPLRAGLRAFLCHKGWRWKHADDRAARILALAFVLLGVERPSWQDGQPEVRDECRYSCLCCGGAIEHGTERGRLRRYCSDHCRWRHIGRIKSKMHYEDIETRKLAFEVMRANGELTRQCGQCGETFQVTQFKLYKKFCSTECALAAKRATALPERICPACHATYKPRRTKQVYCSLECRDAKRSFEEKVCEHCGDHYTPRSFNAATRGRWCSERCGNAAAHLRRKIAAMKAA